MPHMYKCGAVHPDNPTQRGHDVPHLCWRLAGLTSRMPSRLDIVTFHDAPPPPGERRYVPGRRAVDRGHRGRPDPALDAVVRRAGRRGCARPWAGGSWTCSTSGRRRCRAWPRSRSSTSTWSSPTPPTRRRTCRRSRPRASSCRCASPGGSSTGCCATPTRAATCTSSGPTRRSRSSTASSATGCAATPTSVTSTPAPSARPPRRRRVAGEHSMQYNARKEKVVREIYARAFAAAGLLDR